MYSNSKIADPIISKDDSNGNEIAQQPQTNPTSAFQVSGISNAAVPGTKSGMAVGLEAAASPNLAALSADSMMMNHNVAAGAFPVIGNKANLTLSSSLLNQQASSDGATPTSTTLGGVTIPPLPPNSTTAMQVQVFAAAAAAAAAPPKGYNANKSESEMDVDMLDDTESASQSQGGKAGAKKGTKRANSGANEMTPEEKKKLSRDRNRRHAKSTRLRKKAYVNTLKEFVDVLHAERSDEDRKRRVAMQHLAEVQGVRRAVMKSFLKFHAGYESDVRKWMTILEDNFFFKQPVTPYRSFRQVEIEQSKERESRVTRGIEGMIRDAASMSVMTENVGSRSARWRQIKRDEFLGRSEALRQCMPNSIERQNRPAQHAVSSLSSSSGWSNGNGSSGEEDKRLKQSSMQQQIITDQSKSNGNLHPNSSSKKVSSSSSGGSNSSSQQQSTNNDYHDYHAQPLPDPRLDSGGSSTGCDSSGSDGAVAGKNVCTDSSGDEEKPTKVGKASSVPINPPSMVSSVRDSTQPKSAQATSQNEKLGGQPPNSSRQDPAVKLPPKLSGLPSNIARSGGISTNVLPKVGTDMNSRLTSAPAIPLPPFTGIGKRATSVTKGAGESPSVPVKGSANQFAAKNPSIVSSEQVDEPSILTVSKNASDSGRPSDTAVNNTTGRRVARVIDNDITSDDSSCTVIQAHYHVNEDDMLLTDDVLMCPFIFRTHDAVLCGALAECVMPGMLRAQFSSRNKLMNVEIVFDAMGFMQQLDRASGYDGKAKVVPNSLEMALQPNVDEARVITVAKPPFLIVTANEEWKRLTKYTQMEAEGNELKILHGKHTNSEEGNKPGKPAYVMTEVAKGRPACDVNVYYDKQGREFIAFVSSYPLTNANEQVTHLLHVFKELPSPTTIFVSQEHE